MQSNGARWKKWSRLWKGWVIVPTGIGVSVLTVLQWRRITKDSRVIDNTNVSSFQITCYRAVPFRALSRAWGWLSSCYVPPSLRCWLYTRYANIFGVNVEEAAYSLEHYDTLCEFFVRPLKDGVRPIAEFSPVVSPADGNVVTAGKVTSCNVEQIKGVTYTIHTFLGEPTWRNEKSDISRSKSYNDILDKSADYTESYMSLRKTSVTNLRDIESSNPVSTDYEMVRLDLTSAVMSKDVNTVFRYNNWMLGWLIFYFRFCITDLLKYSFYIGFQLIYAIPTNILINGKVFNGASFLKSQLKVNFTLFSKREEKSKKIVQLSNKEEWNTNETGGEVTALCDPYWDQYKKQLLQKEENNLYQLVIYLAPGDYHRFHSPVDWHVKHRRHFQGELLSVNPRIAGWIPELFSLNERAVYIGKWEHGFFSMIAVGATNVGSIRVRDDKDLQTNTRKWRNGLRYRDQALSIDWKKGQEIGEFRLGSTIVLLFEAPKDFKFIVKSGDRVKVGQAVINCEV